MITTQSALAEVFDSERLYIRRAGYGREIGKGLSEKRVDLCEDVRHG